MSEDDKPRRRVLITPIEPIDAVDDTKPNKAPTKPEPTPIGGEPSAEPATKPSPASKDRT